MTALLALLLVGWPAAQGDDPLQSRLEEAAQAEFSGREMVVCWAPVGPVAVIHDVRQADGKVWVHRGGDQAVATGSGLLATGRFGWEGIQVLGEVGSELADRYRPVVGATATRFDRPVVPVEVWEGSLLRARFVFDRETSAVLSTEVLYPNGATYRMSTLIEFSPRAPSVPEPAETPARQVWMAPAQEADFPEALAGYRREGLYQAPEGGVQGYFSDGLFAFSVFALPGAVDPGEMASATEMRKAGRSYRVRYLPSEAWVFWRSGDRSYLVVGDLPPDHLEEVLEGLPRPDRPGLIRRLWERLVGG